MALPRNPRHSGISHRYFSKTQVLTTVEKTPRLNFDPNIVTQFKNLKGKQEPIHQKKNKEPEYETEEKAKKKKKKYLPAERLLLKLMDKKTKSQYDAEKMEKITASIRRVLDPKNDKE
jgi:hypothetical protein